MKKEMILEKWKTKTISLLMAGIMVFAMAPLGTAVAFADEENAEPAEEPAVEAVEEPAVEDVEALQVNAMEEEPGEAEPQVQAMLTNWGPLKIDLSKGPYKTELNTSNPSITVQTMIAVLQMNSQLQEHSIEAPSGTGSYINLDGAGTDYDIHMYGEGNPSDSITKICFEKLDTCNIKGSFTVNMDAEMIKQAESMEDPDHTGFYSGITFIFDKAPAAKKANTLTLKAKKMTKIKAKKMKKKARSFNLSKFVTISGAQGPVTYAKASGSKKITVASNGKVTLKKKIKKGTYKVKVNVTAAGNTNFNAVTKAVTFKVKVK